MAADPEQLLLQGLMSLFGGLLGVSLGAWLTGIYKIKGEITGRAEKMDAILNEVRETAKATELSKIAARAEGIDAIIKEVAQATQASEGAKIATRLEKLDQILPEVRAVTETQKRIEASVAGGEWDRQWRLNHLRDAYARLMAAVYGLQDSYFVFANFAKNPHEVPEAEAREADLLYRKYAAEFKTAAALTRIFAGPRATFALDDYERRIQARQQMTLPSARPQQALKDLADLHHELLQAAREDLHVS
jgi:hypothetical protein